MNKFLFTFLYFTIVNSLQGYPDKRLLLNVNDAFNVGDIDDRHVTEASGLCASRIHPGILYTHNDHGGSNKLYAIDSQTAQVVSVITINGATNGDWEDLACGKCFGHLSDFCIYIGDIGDAANRQTVYRVEEPPSLTNTVTVNLDGTLRYSWKESDAETLMVTPDAELYIISKVDHASNAVVGLIPSSGWSQSTHVPITVTGNLNGIRTSHKDPVGGDISPDGQEILIKTKESVFHFNMNGGNDFFQVLSGVPVSMPYHKERDGESVAFSADGRTYFTLGEGKHEPLYRYDAAV